MKRVTKAAVAIKAIAELPDSHCALHLLRYQAGRMNYLARTTPAVDIESALGFFDSSIREGYETIVGKRTSEMKWSQAALPTRLGGLGLVSARANADAAYCASRAIIRDQGRAIYPSSPAWNDAVSEGDPFQLAAARVNAELPPDEAISFAVERAGGSGTCSSTRPSHRNWRKPGGRNCLRAAGHWTRLAYKHSPPLVLGDGKKLFRQRRLTNTLLASS
jgi:hypothetical protein